MEVSTVSPLFTSPTNGPGQCEINVSSVAMHIVTLFICLCGLVGNGAFLWLLHIDTITDFVVFNQASIDFLFLIFMVPSSLLFLVEEVSCSALMSPVYLSLLSRLSLFTYTMGMYRLMFISIERCRSVICQFFCVVQLSKDHLWVMMKILFWALFFLVIAVNPIVTSLCQSHEQEQCRVVLTSMYAVSLFLFTAPMVTSIILLFIDFKPGSQQQQHRRLDIVIFLVALFSLPLSLWFLLQQLGYRVVPSQTVFLLTGITSSTKPFIYFLLGSWKRDCSMRSCWRHCSMESCRKHSSIQSLRKAIHRVFGEPEENISCGSDLVANTGV
ncbi:mas-related G-protein coupled receptor member D-like isoform 1-T2 [Geothlypis trichas]